jgi:hypothetical protein
MSKTFWIAFAVSAALFGGLLQLVGLVAIGIPPARPPIPIPGREYVSATREGQTDQSLFYFDMFGFGQRIKNAEFLVAGSSHAEFGISAAMLGGGNRKRFNMGLGGGESIDFAIILLDRYKPILTLLVLDPFTTDHGLSTEGRRVLGLSRGDACLRVFEIWAGFLRDWAMQAFLPRVTIANWTLKFEHPVGPIVIRDWWTADVTAFYSQNGEIYADPGKGHAFDQSAKWRLGVKPTDADVLSLKGRANTTLVTAIPYPSYNENISRDLARAIDGTFVPITPADLTFYDFHHLNARGRELATAQLRAGLMLQSAPRR